MALLPLSVGAATICLAAGVFAFWTVRQGASLVPLALLALIAIAWVPIDLPPVMLLWSGRLALLVWIAVACAMVASVPWHVTRFPRPAHRTAAALAFFCGLLSWWQVSTQVPDGDEPHYLVITQSLLKGGDLRIENNHRQLDFRRYFPEDLQPDFRVRGRDREIYSIHAPGVSALVAPAFLVGGYPGAVLFLLAFSAAGSALAWHLAWRVTRRYDAAWFGWAAVTLSPTWIFHSFTVYPDGPGAVLLLTGAWALVRLEREAQEQTTSTVPWLWHGAALAVLPWLHTRFAVLAAGVCAVALLRMSRVPNAAAKAFAFLLCPAVSCFGWLAYFIAVYGTPDPSAPYGGEEGAFGFVPDGLAGLLFDQRFGLLAYAPALVFAFAGVGVMLGRREWRRYAVELLFVILPYLVVVTYVAMWWGGRSAPARFFMPVLPWMALPAAAAWCAVRGRATRVTALAALVFGAFASIVLVVTQDGALAFNTREGYASWLEWLNGSVDLGRALPVWWRDDEVPLFRGILVWSSAAAVSWLLLREIEKRQVLGRRADWIVAATLVFAAGGWIATSVAWTAGGIHGDLTTSSQLDALRMAAHDAHVAAFSLSPPARLPGETIAAALRMTPERSIVPGGAGRNDRPLFLIPRVPAGEYSLRPTVSGGQGWLMIGIGHDQFAIQTRTLAEAQQGLVVRFPVGVQALIVRGDEDARRHVRGIEITPVRLVAPEARLTAAYARHAVRYADSTAYFLDERSYPEPEAFWTKGEAVTEIVIQPDNPRSDITLALRNGATANSVSLVTSRWSGGMRLEPGEERRVRIPRDAAADATLVRITTTAGFTPSAVDPQSRDNRYLGVWVRVE